MKSAARIKTPDSEPAFHEVISKAALDPLKAADRDIRASAALLDQSQARYLVDLYYQTQEYRIRAAAQQRAALGVVDEDGEETTEPMNMVGWTFHSFKTIENTIKYALGKYAQANPSGQWMLSIIGIGPVLAAGLLAHIDITRCPTAGHLWSFAGLSPHQVWKKGQKRPWNARLKTLCWKISDSFVKQSGHAECVYGYYYRERKAIEVERNERGDFAPQAAKVLQEKNIKAPETLAYYQSGKLPPGHVDARARRWSVKLYLAHAHHVLHVHHYKTPPPRPYVLEHLGHVHYIPVPNFE